jgi:hypothetical protein
MMYSTLIGMSAVGLTALNAHASFIGSVVGYPPGTPITGSIGAQSSLTVARGDTFSGAVLLQASPGSRIDFSLFRLVFSEPGLSYSSGWSQWASPFTRGGLDDFSTPSWNSSGIIGANSHIDVFSPGVVDIAFENLTDNFGDYFYTGLLVSFTLSVPSDFQPGAITVSFVPETFSDGAETVVVSVGSSLAVTVVPTPASGFAVLLGALVTFRRRRAV